MRLWILAGLFSLAAAPVAAAAEATAECQLDESRRAQQQRAEQPAQPPASIARPTMAQRDVAAEPPRTLAERRRTGKRIPDAELIGPRGAL